MECLLERGCSCVILMDVVGPGRELPVAGEDKSSGSEGAESDTSERRGSIQNQDRRGSMDAVAARSAENRKEVRKQHASALSEIKRSLVRARTVGGLCSTCSSVLPTCTCTAHRWTLLGQTAALRAQAHSSSARLAADRCRRRSRRCAKTRRPTERHRYVFSHHHTACR